MATRKLRVLTYNVKMLPGPFGDGDEDLARATAIAETIVAETPKWDVVCLQEVFDEEVRERFVSKLQKHFPYKVPKSSDHDIFHEDSGLFFASRHPIAGHAFVEFDASAGTDSLSDKGVFGARLDVDGCRVVVFQTHLQSDVQHTDVRGRQLVQMRNWMRRALQRAPRPGETICIACGDFNVVGEHGPKTTTDEYVQMVAKLGWPRDLFREGEPEDAGFTWDGSHNLLIPRDDTDKQRLDYLLAYDWVPAVSDSEITASLRRAELTSVAVRRFETATPKLCLSDHFALDATIEWAV